MAGGILDHVRIAGIAGAVPAAVRTLDDDAAAFGVEEMQRLSKNLGIKSRHIATESQCASDLCAESATRLLSALEWDPKTIDVLIFVSVTADHVMPATSCILQDRLGLSKSCGAFDITHACSGYIYGLWTAAQFLATGHARRVLLLAGDTASRLVSPQDRSVATLFGDAGTTTALEHTDISAPMGFDLGSDGSGAHHLMVNAGGMRHPTTAATALRRPQDDGAIRCDNDLFMNGSEVFAFTLREVPPLNARILAQAGWSSDDVDAWVMHQANAFMLKYLARSMALPMSKVVSHLETVGNTSVASIPLAIAGALGEQVRSAPLKLVLLGFGTGLSWGAASLTCGPIVVPPLAIVA